MSDFRFHPAADLFPLIEGVEFDRLVESIRSQGYDPNLPVVVDHDGSIIDGRNRWRACQVLGITPPTVVYEGDDPYGEAVKLNIDRRHLTPSQIAGILVKSDVLRRAKKDADDRQSEAGKLYGRGQDSLGPTGPKLSAGKSSEIVAKEHGIGYSTLDRVQRATRDAPELLDEIIAGEITANKAELMAKAKRPAGRQPRPSNPRPEPTVEAEEPPAPIKPVAAMVTRTGNKPPEMLVNAVASITTLLYIHDRDLNKETVSEICKQSSREEVSKWISAYSKGATLLRSMAAVMKEAQP